MCKNAAVLKSAARYIPLVLASICALLATVAVWVQRQVLNTDVWTETSVEMLQQETVRTQVANFLVEQLYANVDVPGELEKALPKQIDPLAAPIAGGLQSLADKEAANLLGTPAIQSVWGEANRATQETLKSFLEGDDGALQAQDGKVTLNLSGLAQQVGDRLGIQNLDKKLPASAANLEIAQSDQLKAAQQGVKVLKGTALVLFILTLLLYALHIGIARGARREAVRSAGISLIVVGVVALLLKGFAGSILVNNLVTNVTIQPAAGDAWSVLSGLLGAQSWSLIAYGVVAILGAWFAGPSARAKRARKSVAPWAKEPLVAYTAFVVLILILLAWQPLEGLRFWPTAIVLIALLTFGFEVLRRRIAKEFPRARKPDFGAKASRAKKRTAKAFAGFRKSASRRGGSRRNRGGDSKGNDDLDRIAGLAKLRKDGAITEAEFKAEKRRLLGKR